jgi:hypothetical protein
MTDSWRQADAQAHEAKAEAIEHALAALDAVRGFAPTMLRNAIDAAAYALEAERARHEQQAKLVTAP